MEDDEPVAESLRRGLKRYGFEVEWVSTGAAALAHPGPYDVVLLDLGLPDTDGLDVCKALRALITMIGMSPRPRSTRQTSSPSVSGRPRSRRTTS